jgi:8-oxo-dGTP pyrophosphatase MutT (NUDIX family)
MIRAAGILYQSRTGQILLVHRTDGLGWAFPGGHIEDGETVEECARREFGEETGQKIDGPLALWTRRISPPVGSADPVATINEGTGAGDIAAAEPVDFTTYLYRGDAFEPTLNAEHDAWQWVDREFALTSGALHLGCYIALQRFDMDELGVAEAIRDGQLTSPQHYANMLLIAIRITGTGVAYRPAHDEFPFRDPAHYLTPEFLKRCNGLPVILEHPKKSMLNTEEFRDRIAGTVFLPYIQGDEVWGIAKILDMEVAAMLEAEKMSTSPGVYCGGDKLSLSDGSTLLMENKPSLVDHIALLYADPEGNGGKGVWDKGKEMSGVESIDAVAVADSASTALDDLVRSVKIHELVRRASRF